MRRWERISVLAMSGVLLCGATVYGLSMDFCAVGDAGNVADTRHELPGYGSVNYTYSIGTYEVTNAQYCEFLNAVAASDSHGLYDLSMAGGWNDMGGILREGSPGTYTYSVRLDRGNRPVNYVSWYDAVRFCNWMTSGDTETGSYDLTGGDTLAVERGADAVFALPTEEEWYKAAYYKSGGTDAGYWEYATQSDTMPTSEAPAGTNLINGSANYSDGAGAWVDPVDYTTEVGAYSAKPSTSAYGTFDQGGNLWEWNEALIGVYRGARGGSFVDSGNSLQAAERSMSIPADGGLHMGFRVVVVPEPAGILLVAFGAVALGSGRVRGRVRS